MRPFLLFLALVLGCSSHALARDVAGALVTLIVPNSGLPACIAPGGIFEILVRAESTAITLEQDARTVSLQGRDPVVTAEGVRMTCDVPEGTAPGAWALRVDDDLNRGAVFVLPEAPQSYTIALLVLRPGTWPEMAVLREVRDAGAALLVIMGEIEAYGRLVATLDVAPLPVILCPPSGATREFSRFFGPANTGFRYGPDGFLRFSTPDQPMIDDVAGGDAYLQRWQRALRPCRWRIGLADRVGPDMGLRRQFVLFVDSPLDYCLARISSFAPLGTPIHRVSWGSTVVGVASDTTEAPFRLVRVDQAGLSPAELQTAN